MEERTLDSLAAGEGGIAADTRLHGMVRRRLQDVGLVSGTPVVCLQKTPSGSLGAYRIRGAVIALRKEMAEQILMEE